MNRVWDLLNVSVEGERTQVHLPEFWNKLVGARWSGCMGEADTGALVGRGRVLSVI